MTTDDAEIVRLLGDMTTSYWLRQQLVDMDERDPVDMLHDCAQLAIILQGRVERLAAAKPEPEGQLPPRMILWPSEVKDGQPCYHRATSTQFEKDSCETCGEAVQAVNAIKMYEANSPKNVPLLISTCKRAGFQLVHELPPEIWHSEELGQTICDRVSEPGSVCHEALTDAQLLA